MWAATEKMARKIAEGIAAVFGSYGWAGGAVNSIESALKEAGIKLIQSPLSIRYVPDENEIEHCYNYGKEFAKKIKPEE